MTEFVAWEKTDERDRQFGKIDSHIIQFISVPITLRTDLDINKVWVDSFDIESMV